MADSEYNDKIKTVITNHFEKITNEPTISDNFAYVIGSALLANAYEQNGDPQSKGFFLENKMNPTLKSCGKFLSGKACVSVEDKITAPLDTGEIKASVTLDIAI